MTKLYAGNISQAINQLGAQTAPYQWLRELVVNGLEAGASQLEVDPVNDELFNAYGAYKVVVSDDGKGMTSAELLKFMRSLFESGKSQGAVDENMGIGGRISTLLWNTLGVVYLSLKDGEAHMCWLHKNEHNEYEIRDFWDEDLEMEVPIRATGEYTVDGVTVDWTSVIPDYVWDAGHGTAVVLLGDTKEQEVRLGDPRVAEEGWRLDKDGNKIYANMPEWRYLTRRFWALGEVEHEGDYTWTPSHPEWTAGKIVAKGKKEADNVHDQHMVYGSLHNIFHPQGIAKDKHPTIAHGVMDLSESDLPAKVHWFLRNAPLPSGLFSWWRVAGMGYTAALYRDELYEISRNRFRQFGVGYSDVYDRLFLIVEPVASGAQLNEAKGDVGVRPNNVRSRLLWGDNTRELSWDDWARRFRTDMPKPIQAAIEAYEASLPALGGLDPQTYARVANFLKSMVETSRIRRDLTSSDKFAAGEKQHPAHRGTGQGAGGGGGDKHGTGTGGGDAGTRLTEQSGDEPGRRQLAFGDIPEVRFVKQAQLRVEGEDESKFYGVSYVPGGKTSRDAILIADDFQDIDTIRRQVAADFAHNPAVTAEVLEKKLRNVVGESVLVHVGVLLRRRGQYGSDVREKLYSPLYLTQSVVGLHSEYKQIRDDLAKAFGSTKTKRKGKIAIVPAA